MSNIQDWKFEVTVGKDGTNLYIALNDVLYVPDLWLDLISLTKAIYNPNIKLGTTSNGLTNGYGHILRIDINPISEKMVCLTGTCDFIVIYVLVGSSKPICCPNYS
jgi:hypothetical protein